jgi:3-dehydroquinate dehydratase-2
MKTIVYVINGPNLNLLGVREPHIYGAQTLADLAALCQAEAAAFGWTLVFRQSNHQGEIIEWLHEARGRAAGVVVNPAAYCYSSYAILDALKMLDCPAIEVHISNIHAREPEWRSHTITASASTGMISGLGLNGYRLAIAHIADLAGAKRTG